MRSVRIVAVLAATALSLSAHGADVRFRASVDRNRVELGDTVVLTVTISVPDRAAIEGLQLPKHEGFDQISSSESTQMSFSFGSGGQAMEQIATHTIALRALATGVQTLSPGILRYKGATHRTRPIKITVLKPGQLGPSRTPRPKPQRQVDPLSGLDPFDILRGMDPEAGGRDEDVFLRVTADRKSVYLGEQVTLHVQVYSRTGVGEFPSFKMPELKGFWAEDLDSPKRITPTTKYVGGVRYSTYLLRRLALFPTKSGRLTIDPVEIEIVAGFGFFAPGRTITRRSEPVTVEVKPLPAEGQPRAFSTTNVGQWDLEAKVSPERTTLGQPVTLTVTARGTGNLESLEMPDLPPLDGLKAYEPTRSSAKRLRGVRFGGEKKVEWVVVPTRTGQLVIPPVRLDWFDPAAGEYRGVSTRRLSVVVEAGSGDVVAGAPSLGAAAAGPSNVLDAAGLRGIRYAARLERVAEAPYKRTSFLVMVTAPVLALLLLVGAGRARGALAAVGNGRKAQGQARARLKTARRLKRKGDFPGVFSAVDAALLELVTARTGLPARGMPRDVLSRALMESGWPELRVERLLKILEDCENARYSPVAPTAAEVDALLERAVRVLADVEQQEARA